MDGPIDVLISRSVRLTRRGFMLVAIGLGMTAGGALLHTTAENDARSSHTISEVHQAARRPISTADAVPATPATALAQIHVNRKTERTNFHSKVDTELLQPWEIDYGNAQRVVISMQTDKRELAAHEVALLERTIADVAAGRLAQASPEAVLAIEMATRRPLRTAIAVEQHNKIEQVRQAELLGAALLSIIAAMALTVGVVAMTIGQVIDSRLRRIVSLKARACIALHPDRSGS